jgi:anti-sigma regulatory factor (Ser/Thr protein kinase)
MADVVTLQLPRGRDFRAVAHLVLGGFATRLDLTYDVLDDIQTALDELLEQGDAGSDVTLALRLGDGAVHATVGPFGGRVVDELQSEGEPGLGLRRVLETVVDDISVEARDGSQWVELTKRVPGRASA